MDAGGRSLSSAAGQTERLTGLRIAVDAFNWDLKEGTGIATYSRTLCSALQTLGCEPALIFERDVGSSSDALVDEVSFYGSENIPIRGRVASLLRYFGLLRQAFSFSPIEAYRVLRHNAVVLAPADRSPYDIFNASNAGLRAHVRHLWTGRFSRLTLPDQFDVLHLTYPWPLTAKSMKIVTTVHDLIPLRLPYTTLDSKREIVRRLRRTVEQSDLILTVSESSKRDMVDLLGASPDKIEVTYQTADLEPLADGEHKALDRTISRFGLTADGYALFVGAIEPKKNLKRLVQAYLAADVSEPLVVVGRRAWMWEEQIREALAVNERSTSPRVIFLDYVSRDDLRFLYAGARCLLFPSLYEGFGLPCLEAMGSGTPVLTSSTSSLPEICGEAAVYVDPFDVANMRNQIEAIMSDGVLRGDLSAKGRARAELFSMERYLAALTSAYGRL